MFIWCSKLSKNDHFKFVGHTFWVRISLKTPTNCKSVIHDKLVFQNNGPISNFFKERSLSEKMVYDFLPHRRERERLTAF